MLLVAVLGCRASCKASTNSPLPSGGFFDGVYLCVPRKVLSMARASENLRTGFEGRGGSVTVQCTPLPVSHVSPAPSDIFGTRSQRLTYLDARETDLPSSIITEGIKRQRSMSACTANDRSSQGLRGAATSLLLILLLRTFGAESTTIAVGPTDSIQVCSAYCTPSLADTNGLNGRQAPKCFLHPVDDVGHQMTFPSPLRAVTNASWQRSTPSRVEKGPTVGADYETMV